MAIKIQFAPHHFAKNSTREFRGKELVQNINLSNFPQRNWNFENVVSKQTGFNPSAQFFFLDKFVR